MGDGSQKSKVRRKRKKEEEARDSGGEPRDISFLSVRFKWLVALNPRSATKALAFASHPADDLDGFEYPDADENADGEQ